MYTIISRLVIIDIFAQKINIEKILCIKKIQENLAHPIMQKYLQNHKSSDHKEVSTYLISCKPSHITVFCDLPKIHFLYLCLPHPHSNQYYQHVIAPPKSSQTMSQNSCNILLNHSHRTSATVNISYNSLNHFTKQIKLFSILLHLK